jgi:hypothetical protein
MRSAYAFGRLMLAKRADALPLSFAFLVPPAQLIGTSKAR